MKHFTIKMTPETLGVLFADLADAAKTCTRIGGSYICSTVANLIAASGTMGGHEQTEAMDLAKAVGFTPEYYAGSIRVGYADPKRSASHAA